MFLSSVRHSSKLIKPEEVVLGSSDLLWIKNRLWTKTHVSLTQLCHILPAHFKLSDPIGEQQGNCIVNIK